jgi:hypothetical protein
MRAPFASFLIAIAIPFALADCGSDDSATATTDSLAATADLTPYKGIYVAEIKKADLVQKGATGPDAPGGTWTLSIAETDPGQFRVDPAGFDLRPTRVSNGRVTFAPNTVCPSAEGRTKPSVYEIQKTDIGIKFLLVKAGCPPDAAPLTLGNWRKT